MSWSRFEATASPFPSLDSALAFPPTSRVRLLLTSKWNFGEAQLSNPLDRVRTEMFDFVLSARIESMCPFAREMLRINPRQGDMRSPREIGQVDRSCARHQMILSSFPKCRLHRVTKNLRGCACMMHKARKAGLRAFFCCRRSWSCFCSLEADPMLQSERSRNAKLGCRRSTKPAAGRSGTEPKSKRAFCTNDASGESGPTLTVPRGSSRRAGTKSERPKAPRANWMWD